MCVCGWDVLTFRPERLGVGAALIVTGSTVAEKTDRFKIS